MPSMAALQTVCPSLWNSRYSYFLETGITESIAPTECLKSYSFDKDIDMALYSVVIRRIQQDECYNIYATVLV